MSLSKELAAVLRSVRAVKGLSQQDLGDASDRKHLWLMESAKSSPTLNKFDELAKALQVSPVTLLALCVALRDGIGPIDVLSLVRKELDAFEAAGGCELTSGYISGKTSNSRASERRRKLAAVQECKRQGLTQRATGEKLGIPRSTVSDLWKLQIASEI